MMSVDTLGFSDFFRIKKSGMPIAAPLPKHSNWRFVRLNIALVLMRVKSLGMVIYGIVSPFLTQNYTNAYVDDLYLLYEIHI